MSQPTIHSLNYVVAEKAFSERAQAVLAEVRGFFRVVLEFPMTDYLALDSDEQAREGLDATEWEGSWAVSALACPEEFERRRREAMGVAQEFQALAEAHPDLRVRR